MASTPYLILPVGRTNCGVGILWEKSESLVTLLKQVIVVGFVDAAQLGPVR